MSLKPCKPHHLLHSEKSSESFCCFSDFQQLYAQGQDRITVLNQRDNDVIIKKGVQIAEKQLVKPKEADKKDTDSIDQTGIKEVHND